MSSSMWIRRCWSCCRDLLSFVWGVSSTGSPQLQERLDPSSFVSHLLGIWKAFPQWRQHFYRVSVQLSHGGHLICWKAPPSSFMLLICVGHLLFVQTWSLLSQISLSRFSLIFIHISSCNLILYMTTLNVLSRTRWKPGGFDNIFYISWWGASNDSSEPPARQV